MERNEALAAALEVFEKLEEWEKDIVREYAKLRLERIKNEVNNQKHLSTTTQGE